MKHTRLSAFVWLGIIAPTFADETPSRTLAEKGALVFSDNFSSDRFANVWIASIPRAGVENDVMFGRQTTTAHGSVAGHIARVTLEQQFVKLHDDKEGAMNNNLIALRKLDDAKAEPEEAVKLHTLIVPMTLETQR